MYIYIFKSVGLQQPLWKIGHSNNPIRRLAELQTGCPFKIKEYVRIRCDGVNHNEIERLLHDKLSAHRQRGGREWYKVTEEWMTTVLFEVKLRYIEN